MFCLFQKERVMLELSLVGYVGASQVKREKEKESG